MNLLAGTVYDPAVAVTKNTTAALAMTAIDTTNLRLRFTVPPSGRVRVRMMAVVHGATTFPSILMGVMDGATVKGRVAPVQSLGNTAVATALVNVEADFLVTGLTPGTDTNWDAAYGVETLIAATGIKYGGPNNTVANDAFGGFVFEIWDPSPAYSPAANGVPPTTTLHTKIDTIDDFVDTEVADIQARLPAALVSGRIDASVGAMAANVLTAAAINAAAITAAKFAAGAIDAAAIAADAIGASELAADAVAEIVNAVWDETTAEARTAGTYGQLLKDNVNATISSRASQTSLDTVDDFLDTEVAAILAAVDTEVASILADTTNLKTRVPAALVGGRMDSSIGSYPGNTAQTGDAFARLGAPAGASVSADVAAVKAETATILSDTNDIQTRLPAALVSGRIPAIAEVIGVDAVDSVALATSAANEIADAILDRAAAIEGLTPRELARLTAAVLLGKASGLATTTAVYRNLADTKDRVTATVDGDGNRSSVTRDAT